MFVHGFSLLELEGAVLVKAGGAGAGGESTVPGCGEGSGRLKAAIGELCMLPGVGGCDGG